MDINIRRFEIQDVIEVEELIHKNLLEVNVKDYPIQEMEELRDIYSSPKIIEISHLSHLYVAILNNEIIGCGAIQKLDKKSCEFITIFVSPNLQNQGVGKTIMSHLEKDEYYIHSKKAVIHASITACDFYIQLGYSYTKGGEILDDDGLYCLEKDIKS